MRNRPMILVVDDEPLVAQMLARALNQVGLAARTTGSGAVAVDVYRAGGIDLVVLDIQMPDPWDGPQTLAALRAIDPGVRAVFVSGHTGAYAPEELIARGALRVFAKPLPSLVRWAEELRALVPGAGPPASSGARV